MEVKTITVHPRTHRELMMLKQQTNSPSFDYLLSQLVKEKVGARKSMFGAAKGLRAGFERDRRDRI